MSPADDDELFVTVDAVWDGAGFRGATTFRADREHLHPVDGIPPHARQVALGGTILPRLTDYHTHLGLTDQHRLLAGGITHAIDLGWIPAVATSWLADDRRRPAVAIAGSLITAPGGYPVNAGWGPPGSSAEVSTRREAREAVRENVRLGASRIKATLNAEAGPTLDDDLLRNIVGEARAQGVPVTVHVQGEGQTRRALEAGVDQLAHAPFTERVGDELLHEALAHQCRHDAAQGRPLRIDDTAELALRRRSRDGEMAEDQPLGRADAVGSQERLDGHTVRVVVALRPGAERVRLAGRSIQRIHVTTGCSGSPTG